MSTLLLDRDLPLTRYCSRIWTIFSCRNGIFSPLDRLKLGDAGGRLYYFHPDETYEALAAEVIGAAPLRSEVAEEVAFGYLDGTSDALGARFDRVIDSADLAPNLVLGRLSDQIVADLELLKAKGDYAPLGERREGVSVVGDPAEIILHREAEIFPGTIFDVRDGPVIVDAQARVGQFSYLRGPAYIGPATHVDNCRVIGPVALGRNCRVGGEIEASVFGDFSNKHHEGFLGHSFVGRWANLGALVTTSDLKNNYGQVRLNLPKHFLASADGDTEPVSTETIKFGAIISDCAKIAIGMRLNTGTVIDVGCNVFDMTVPKYLAPFSWGGQGDVYDLERFHGDCQVIFARRRQAPSEAFRNITRYIWTRCHR